MPGIAGSVNSSKHDRIGGSSTLWAFGGFCRHHDYSLSPLYRRRAKPASALAVDSVPSRLEAACEGIKPAVLPFWLVSDASTIPVIFQFNV